MTEPALRLGLAFDLDFIAEHWDALREMRRPGTARPWRQALLDPERRAAQARRDLEERANRDPDAPGFTSAPEHVDVLDVMVEAWVALDELVHRISPDWRRSRTGHARGRAEAEYGPASFTDIAPMIEFINTWIGEAADIADGPAQQLHRLTTEMSRLLGLVRAGQILSGAVCPWCRGVTPKHPAGGATTLRVEEVAKAKTATTLRPAVEAVHAVVCWNPLCDPPDEDCGIRYRGRPAWPWHEWEWLAKRLIIADPPISVPPKATFWDDESIYPIIHSGRSGVDQAVAVAPPRGLLARQLAEQAGQPIRFVGGPFHGQRRRFIRVEPLLGVNRSISNGRPRLDSPDSDEARLGSYRFEIVNDEASYVWVSYEQVSA